MPEDNQAENLTVTTTGATRSAETARARINGQTILFVGAIA